MQTARLVQAVALLLVVALAASCAASKEYSSKLFAPRTPEAAKDSQALALRFLDFDNEKTEEKGWVSTDVIMGRDSSGSTFALDNFSKSFPATTPAPKAKTDSIVVNKDSKPVLAEAKPAPVVEEPVAKSIPMGGVRPKKAREE